ncbi:MAG: S8 family serine peptidase [Bacteroidetes bacterium]|nr:S8 family serine peptidase [Bacteroidota bacterium]
MKANTSTSRTPFVNMLTILGLLFTLFGTPLCSAQSIQADYVEGKIWLKLKPGQTIPHTISPVSDEIKISDVPVISRITDQYAIKRVRSPFHKSGSDDISRILSIEFADHSKVSDLLERLEGSGIAEYVEREPKDYACFTPNDPSYGSQWSLAKINAAAAWDISTGNANIVVAIVDNAIQTTHPDLQPNIWVNPGEIAGDGIDNDNNGYIDDINGYDLADGNNDPNPPNTSFSHGTHVAGIVSAKSNNGIGIASIGSNIKLMCVKAAPDASDVMTSATPGIYYAALNNARVINCSFGSASYSTTRQAIIDWAYNRGSIVVAVAGNSGINNKVYPGAMNNVVCVTATNSSDIKESSSTYNSWVDVSAPGTGIYSTIPTNSYTSYTGTSMAAPAVSGLLGLILSVNPNLTQEQAINCLKSTTTNIDALNPSYAGLMGTGRIDALAALQCAQGTVFSLNASPIGLSSGTTCTTSLAMQVVIRNVGTSALSSLKINYKVDNNSPSVHNWTGSLASGSATAVTLPATTFAYGKHTFTAYTSAPNGGVDGFISNDTLKSTINVVQTGAALPFTEGFEGTFPPPDWGLSNPDGELTWAPTTVAKYSGSRSALMLNYYDPFYGTTDYMSTPVLDLTTASNPAISFQVAYQPQTGYPADTLLVLVSTDCGKTYGLLYKKWGSTLATVAGTTTSPFIPSGTTQWRNEAYLLPPSVAASSTAIFIFMNKGGAGNNLYLDDIIIAGTNMAAAVSVVQTTGVNPACSGSSVTFTATPSNGGTTPVYQWKVNGVNVGTNSPTYTTATLTNGQAVTCEMTSNLPGVTGNPATSNSITMTINPSVTPAVSSAITLGNNPACAGALVTFTATPTNGGITPAYQWKVNGVDAGTNSTTFTSSTLTNGQVVTCVLTSNAICANPATATSTGVTMTINSSVTPDVAASLTTGTNPTCAGTSLTFTAAPTNGGTTPAYQWKINGVNAGTNSATFTTSTLTNGQVVTCVLTSNAACASPVTATSTGVTMTINAIPATPVISQAGSVLTSSSATGNQWYLNGNSIPGATNQTHTVAQNGSYTVVVTTNGCSSAPSSPVIMSTVGIDSFSDIPLLNIYPNPTDGNFAIYVHATALSNYTIEIKNMLGQLVYCELLPDFSGIYSKQINIATSGSGIYQVRLKNTKNEIVKKVIIY